MNSLGKFLSEKHTALLCNYNPIWQHKNGPKMGEISILYFFIFHQILVQFFFMWRVEIC
jgi:hypothetical protein